MCAGEGLDTAKMQEYKLLDSFQVEHYGPLCLNSSSNFVQNDRITMFRVGRDLWTPSSPSPLLNQVHRASCTGSHSDMF